MSAPAATHVEQNKAIARDIAHTAPVQVSIWLQWAVSHTAQLAVLSKVQQLAA
jgi:hypothetical protein